MAKLPQISGKDMGRILVRLGFKLKSQKGSHMKFIRNTSYGEEVVVVPNHKIIRKGTLGSILKHLNLDIDKIKELP